MLLLPVRLREGAQHHVMAAASPEMQLVSPVSHCSYTSAGPQSTWHLPCSSSKMLSGLISLRKKAEKERQPLAQRGDRKHGWWHPRKAQALRCWQRHCTLRALGLADQTAPQQWGWAGCRALGEQHSGKPTHSYAGESFCHFPPLLFNLF